MGSVMKATTVHGVVHQGEILAVDNKTKLAFMGEINMGVVTLKKNKSSIYNCFALCYQAVILLIFSNGLC